MKKFFIIYAVTFLPLACYANISSQGDDMEILGKIAFVVFILVGFAVIWVIIDTRRVNKNNEEQRNRKSKTNIDENKISENSELKKEKKEFEKKISKKDEEIKMLRKELSEKDEEIAFLNSQIMELKSSSRNNMSSNESNKQEDNKENNDLGEKYKTSSKIFVGHSNYYELAVINGNLVKAESEQTTYYRAWRENGQILFEFVNNDRTRKAINNRTIIIEPFCIKLEQSKSPDVSEEIETITPGILNDDYTLRKKVEIIYK